MFHCYEDLVLSLVVNADTEEGAAEEPYNVESLKDFDFRYVVGLFGVQNQSCEVMICQRYETSVRDIMWVIQAQAIEFQYYLTTWSEAWEGKSLLGLGPHHELVQRRQSCGGYA